MPKTQFCGYICGIMTTYQQILIILDNFEINFLGALFPPGTAVGHGSNCIVSWAQALQRFCPFWGNLALEPPTKVRGLPSEHFRLCWFRSYIFQRRYIRYRETCPACKHPSWLLLATIIRGPTSICLVRPLQSFSTTRDTLLALTHQTPSLLFPFLILVCSVVPNYMTLLHHDVQLLCDLLDPLMLWTLHYIKSTTAQCALYLCAYLRCFVSHSCNHIGHIS